MKDGKRRENKVEKSGWPEGWFGRVGEVEPGVATAVDF